MQAKLIGFGLLIGGILLAVLKIFTMGKSSAINEIAAKTAVKKQEIKDKAHQANIDGLVDEHAAMHEPIPGDRDDGF